MVVMIMNRDAMSHNVTPVRKSAREHAKIKAVGTIITTKYGYKNGTEMHGIQMRSCKVQFPRQFRAGELQNSILRMDIS